MSIAYLYPHLIKPLASLEKLSSTKYLSFGDLPVKIPVSTINAPFKPTSPSFLLIISFSITSNEGLIIALLNSDKSIL